MRIYQSDKSSFVTDKDMREDDAVEFIDSKALKNRLNHVMLQ